MIREELVQLTNDLMKQIKDIGDISDEVYVSLQLLYPDQIVQSLELIDKDLITKYKTWETDRTYYQVIDPSPDLRGLLSAKNNSFRKRPKNCKLAEGEEEYLILENSSFWPCYEYQLSVLNDDALLWKHLLAVKFASALNSFKDIKEIEEDQFAPSYLSSNLYIRQYAQPRKPIVKLQN